MALLVTLSPLSTASAQMPALPPGYEMQRDEQLITVLPGQTVDVENYFGDVRARYGGDSGELSVLSVRQQFASEGAPVEVVLESAEDRVQVRVGFRDASGTLITRRPDGHKRRADLVLFVPEKAPVSVHTDAGLIQLRGLRSDVYARTTQGEIQIRSIHGAVDVASDQGPVLVALLSRDRTDVQRVHAGKGDLMMILPEDGNFAVDVSGGGVISTEYTLRFAPEHEPVRRARAEVGKGTTPVAVHIGDGHLQLRRRPSAQLARITAEDAE